MNFSGQSRELYRNSIKLRPFNKVLLFEYASWEYFNRQFIEAVAVYNQAIELGFELNYKQNIEFIDSLVKIGQRNRALTILRQLAVPALKIKDVSKISRYALLMQQAEAPIESLRLNLSLIELLPSNLPVLKNIILLNLELDDRDQALRWCQQVFVEDEDSKNQNFIINLDRLCDIVGNE